MKRVIVTIGFMGLLSFVLVNLVACSPANEAQALAEQAATAQVASSGAEQALQPVKLRPSCASPMPEMVADCQARADRILASTVRLEFHGEGGGMGHATVLGGRYLVTHNHYPVTGETISRGGDGLISAVSVLKANGDVILLKAPLSYFSVAVITPEALVLDFHEYSGQGFFEGLGVPSAESGTWAGLDIRPGSEVAQVDWDMTVTRVVWTAVTAVHPAEGTPYVELESYVEQGASGGGVFYNGVHIANTWSRNTERATETGAVLRQYSVAALNSSDLIALEQGAPGVALAGQ